jgi:hypothetical protein
MISKAVNRFIAVETGAALKLMLCRRGAHQHDPVLGVDKKGRRQLSSDEAR